MRKSILLVCFTIVILLLASCKKNKVDKEDNKDKVSSTPYRMDIRDTKTLVIMTTPQDPSNPSKNTNSLYKITSDGNIKEVLCYGEDGSLSSTINVSMIYNLNDSYLLLFSQINYDGMPQVYLLRKNDGVIISFPSGILPQENITFLINPYIQSYPIYLDKNNYLYYPRYNGMTKIYKANISDPNNITETLYSPDHENVNSYEIDSRGNMLFVSHYNSIFSFRLKKANGALENIPNNGNGYFLGTDDNFYYYYQPPTPIITGSVHPIQKIEIDNSYNVTNSQWGSYTINSTNISGHFPHSPYKVIRGTSTILVGLQLTEFEPSAGVINTYPIPTLLENTTDICSSDNFIYFAGRNSSSENSIYKVNINALNNHTSLFPSNKYDTYRVSATKNDVIVFTALRLSDGITLLALIDENNNEKILKENIDKQTVLINIE